MSREPAALHRRATEIFLAACDLDPAAREPVLADACGGDVELRAAVDRLLQADSAPRPDLESPQLGPGVPLRALVDAVAQEAHRGLAPAEAAMPEQIGEFKILRRLGTGGMGIVYEAVQKSPRRVVALKLLRPDLTSPSLLRRLEHEAAMLARLRHPGIAQLYEAGTVETSFGRQPFFTMEAVTGQPVDVFARNRGLGVRERLGLFLQICDAVEHAHRRGVIHRDLKPGNILVDDDGRARVLDFGLARVVDAEAPVTFETKDGEILGTLAYMSPEQAGANPRDVDTRSDVYALGVMLFEILAGRAPIDLRGCSLVEAARRIREDPPGALGAGDPKLRGDLETIVAKALEKDPDRRYGSAAELAEDIRRHLRDEPIAARAPSAVYRLLKFARRHRALVGGIVGVVLALAGGAAVSITMAVRESRQRAAAEKNAEDARAQSYRASLAAAAAALRVDDVTTASRALDEAPESLRGWEWRHLRWIADRSTWTRTGPAIAGAFFSGAGNHVAIVDVRGAATVVDAADGREIFAFSPDGTNGSSFLALSPDGSSFLARRAPGRIALLPTAGGQPVWEQADPATAAAFAPDGSRIAAGGTGTSLRLLAPADGSVVATIELGRAAVPLSFDPRASLIVCQAGGLLAGVDVASGAVRWQIEGALVRFFSNGRNFVVKRGGALLVFDAANGAETGRFEGKPEVSPSAEDLSPDGRLAVVVEGKGVASVWDVRTGSREFPLPGRPAHAHARFSPDGGRILVTCTDGTAQVFDAALGPATPTTPWPFIPGLVFFGENGSRAITSTWGELRMLDVASGALLWSNNFVSRAPIVTAALTRDGSLVAVGGEDRMVHLVETGTGAVLKSSERFGAMPRCVAWLGGDASRLAVAFADGSMRVLAGVDLATEREWRAHDSRIAAMAVSDDGRRLATVAGPDVRTWDATSGARLSDARREGRKWSAIAAGRDGRLFCGAEDGTLVAIDPATGGEVASYEAGAGGIRALTISPDGLRIAAGEDGSAVRVWNAAGGRPLLALRDEGARSPVLALAWSGDTLLAGGGTAAFTLFECGPPRCGFSARERMRRANRRLAEELRDRWLVDEITDHVAHDPDAAEPLRTDVLAAVRALGNHPNYLNSDAWGRVRLPGRPAPDLERALRQIDAACQARPDEWAFENTRGVTQFRLGRFAAARATFERCCELRRREGAPPHGADLAFLAMARFKLGDLAAAAESLAAARAAPRSADSGEQAETDGFLGEASALLGAAAK